MRPVEIFAVFLVPHGIVMIGYPEFISGWSIVQMIDEVTKEQLLWNVNVNLISSLSKILTAPWQLNKVLVVNTEGDL